MVIHIFVKGLQFSNLLTKTGSGVLASAKYLRDQSHGVFPTVSRDYKVSRQCSDRKWDSIFQIKSYNQTLSVTRNVDITFCKVITEKSFSSVKFNRTIKNPTLKIKPFRKSMSRLGWILILQSVAVNILQTWIIFLLKVWGLESDFFDVFFTLSVIILPLLLGKFLF